MRGLGASRLKDEESLDFFCPSSLRLKWTLFGDLSLFLPVLRWEEGGGYRWDYCIQLFVLLFV